MINQGTYNGPHSCVEQRPMSGVNANVAPICVKLPLDQKLKPSNPNEDTKLKINPRPPC